MDGITLPIGLYGRVSPTLEPGRRGARAYPDGPGRRTSEVCLAYAVSMPAALKANMAVQETYECLTPIMHSIGRFYDAQIASALPPTLPPRMRSSLLPLLSQMCRELTIRGYVAVYANSSDNIAIVPWHLYTVMSRPELEATTLHEPPDVASWRAEFDEQFFTVFGQRETAMWHSHEKFGPPLVIVGQNPPVKGCPQTPLAQMNAYGNLTRQYIVTAAKLLKRSETSVALNCTGEGPGSWGHMARSLGPTDLGVETSTVFDTLAALQEKSMESVYANQSKLAARTTTILASTSPADTLIRVENGGIGHMSWAPQSQFPLAMLDIPKNVAADVANSYGIPPGVLGLKNPDGNRSAHTNTKTATESFRAATAMTNLLNIALANLTAAADHVSVPAQWSGPIELKVPVPIDLFGELDYYLKPAARAELYGQVLQLSPDAFDLDRMAAEAAIAAPPAPDRHRHDIPVPLARKRALTDSDPPQPKRRAANPPATYTWGMID